MWQQQQVAATDTNKELLVSMVACMTSKNVSAAVLNAVGTGYAIGDLLEIRHASAEGAVSNHYCQIEVLTLSGSAIATFRINNNGAYAERVASAVVGAAAGSGYAVGDILEVQDGAGTSTEKAKFKVATLSGSAVATVALFETGGAYSTTPTIDEAATLGIGPTAFAGDDLATLDLTVQTIIGTTGAASTAITGGGSAATFDLTLTDTGWAAQYNRNERTSDGVTDHKEVVLLGTKVGADAPYVGFFSYRADSGGQKRYGLACFGMTAFNPSIALTAQPNLGPVAWVTGTTDGSHLLVAEEVAENNIWGFSVSETRITGFIRGNIATEADSYHTFYAGLLNGFGPTTTSPYPIFVGASSNAANRRTSDANSTGLAEAFQSPNGGGPLYFLQKSDLVWTTCRNATTPTTLRLDHVMWPRGVLIEGSPAQHKLVETDNFRMLNDGVIASSVRANVVDRILPAPGTAVYGLLPLTVVSSGGSGTPNIDTTMVGELDGCFFTGGSINTTTSVTPEDEFEQAGKRYIIIPCSTASLSNRPYQFMCFRKD